MTLETVLALPFPPSLNHYWRNIAVAGRPRTLISEEGRRFRALVKDIAWANNAPVLRGRITVEIAAHMPDRRRRDLDNLLKATLDALVHAAVIEDDSLVDDLRIVRAGHCDGGKVIVRVTER